MAAVALYSSLMGSNTHAAVSTEHLSPATISSASFRVVSPQSKSPMVSGKFPDMPAFNADSTTSINSVIRNLLAPRTRAPKILLELSASLGIIRIAIELCPFASVDFEMYLETEVSEDDKVASPSIERKSATIVIIILGLSGAVESCRTTTFPPSPPLEAKTLYTGASSASNGCMALRTLSPLRSMAYTERGEESVIFSVCIMPTSRCISSIKIV
mmetsp:Transcript_25064/g.37108  ORF Transcript_25064/g.37108 Transcript_25064/m.37108 type:complete len:215 (-) Transcript_25064:925-1569(-)